MSPQSPKAFLEGIQQLPQGVAIARIENHVVAPPHVKGVRIEEVDPRREVRAKVATPTKTFTSKPKLDLGAFGLAIHAVLKDRVTGYILQVNQNGTLVHTAIWNWAQTPADKGEGWNENTSMHVASVSKMLTAIGMVKLLKSKRISYDETMSGNLPAHWTRGPRVGEITYRQLVTHRSGFDVPGSATDYLTMKSKVAAGVANIGNSQYENMNFALCRLLIPIISGKVNKSAHFFPPNAGINDQVWDAVTIHHYNNYMQENVFRPAGATASFAPHTGRASALAYQFPHSNKKGWNSGDLSTVSGGAGWRLSARDLLKVMHHVRRANTIISAADTQEMIDGGFGIDQIQRTPAGTIYNKNGAWGISSGTEQCVAHFLPNNMESVIYVNSKIGTEDFSLRNLIHDAFVGALTA